MQFQNLTAWFDAEPADDPVDDLAALRSHFRGLDEQSLSSAAYQGCLDQFEARIRDIGERFKPRLLTSALPLPRALHAAASELVQAMLDVAGGFGKIAVSARERWLIMRRTEAAQLATRALCLVNEAFLLASMSGAPAPAGVWQRVYGLVTAGGRLVGDPGAETGKGGTLHEFKRLVALAVLQPESLTAREVVWVYEYVEGVAALATLANEAIQPETSAHWMEPGSDAAPVAAVRREAPSSGNLVYFSAQGLSRRVAEQIERLEARIACSDEEGAPRQGEWVKAEAEGLPLGLTPAEELSLMRRMRDRWSTPGGRGTARRQHNYSVQVCIGLRAIWETCRSAGETGQLSRWTVYNESLGGYAIMSVAGVASALTPGMVLALRRDARKPWSVCLVRWVRSDNPERAELGLQMIAQGCSAVSVAFSGSEARSMSPALILPPLPGLRAQRAILAASGTYASRRFVLVEESAHLYVAQGRVLSLDLQTSAVELFQYEIDTYPS